MYTLFVKKHSKVFFASICLALTAMSQSFSKPKSEYVKEEEGFYYGYGKASTNEEAIAIAKKDLIETALTSTLRLKNSRAPRVLISDETAKARLVNIKPTYPNPKNQLNVVYKISLKDWEKDSKTYEEALRKKLTPVYDSLSGKVSSAEKIEKSISILNELALAGETDLLTLQAGATELFSRKVEGICQSVLNNMVFAVETKNGIVGPDTEFIMSIKDKSGAAVPNISVKAVWELASLPITTLGEEVAPVISVVKTDNEGKAKIDYPMGEEYLNKIVCLTVSTAFSMSETASKEMRKLDAESSVEGHYVYYENLENAYKSVTVEAGDYKTGAVAQDKRAGVKEKERDATLSAYAIDLAPVTNYQYAAYIYTTESENAPEFFDNYDYNQENQPVIGISAKDAEGYAEWLSEQTGAKYRLPTDDEWEVAARAGVASTYPWGDDVPSKNKCANYKGNGQYKGTSPVGSFMNGSNAWGLVDMSGNVWEWTSSNRSETEGLRTVKGGSWMDGPMDLRISNFKNLEEESNGPDIGFRLVKEVEQTANNEEN
ncbi:MAG: SUMF1/EgtB/PvdO family nonheme iron enzyme [Treponema sp.]|nr:SUMF1/EgtB/PvdO family nonheme iron enzyme [Treponema sp.]